MDELEVGPLLGGDQAFNFVQVSLVASSKVIQSHHPLVKFEQSFEEVAADEAGHARDEPDMGFGFKTVLELIESVWNWGLSNHHS